MSDPTDGDQRKSIRRLGSKAPGPVQSVFLHNEPEETPRNSDLGGPNEHEPRPRPARPSLEEFESAETDRPGRSRNTRPLYDRRQRSRSR